MEALVIVVHGSRQEDSKGVMERLRQDLARRVSCPVHLAYLQFQRPSLPEVIARLQQEGIFTITVVPAFLALGGARSARHSGGSAGDAPTIPRIAPFFLLPPLGYDPRLADIIMDRIREDLQRGELR